MVLKSDVVRKLEEAAEAFKLAAHKRGVAQTEAAEIRAKLDVVEQRLEAAHATEQAALSALEALKAAAAEQLAAFGLPKPEPVADETPAPEAAEALTAAVEAEPQAEQPRAEEAAQEAAEAQEEPVADKTGWNWPFGGKAA